MDLSKSNLHSSPPKALDENMLVDNCDTTCKQNPASFKLDVVTYAAASHPEDRSEEYLDHLHSYVHYTKTSQKLEDIFIKMITDSMPVDDTSKPTEDPAPPTTNPSDTGSTNSAVKHSPDFNSEDPGSGDEVVSDLGSDNVASDSGPDESALKLGGGEGASELGGDEASELGSDEASELGSDEASELGSDEAASASGSDEGGPEISGDEVGLGSGSGTFGAEFQQLLSHLNGDGSDRNNGHSGISIPKSSPTMSPQLLNSLRLLTLENTHVQFRLLRARLEAFLLEKEAELGRKRISVACASNDVSEQDPLLRTWIFGYIGLHSGSGLIDRGHACSSRPRPPTAQMTGKRRRHSINLPDAEQFPKKKRMASKQRSRSF